MENFQGSYSRAAKIKAPPEMKPRKLVIGGGGSSVSPTRFDSENVDLNAPILRYLCGGGSPVAGKFAARGSRSPLSPVENILIARSPPPSPAVYRTPVKAAEGEEVLVMDGIPLRRSSRFSGSESSGSSGKSLSKAEIFHSPEFSHSKEDIRSTTRLSVKNKTESQAHSPYSNSPRLLFASSPDTIFLPETLSPIFSAAPVTPTRTASPAQSTTPVQSASPASSSMTPNQPNRPPRPPLATPKQSATRATSVTPNRASTPATASRITTRESTTALTTAWSPQDDDIEITLPGSTDEKPSSRESVDTHIDSVLYGVKMRRLPVFSEICPDSQ